MNKKNLLFIIIYKYKFMENIINKLNQIQEDSDTNNTWENWSLEEKKNY